MKARVYVTLRSGILDPQGRAVQKTLSGLGFDDVQDVRVGKYIELEIAEKPSGDPGADRRNARERITAMCDRLLANPVIEDYRIELDGDQTPGRQPEESGQ